jgi:hypothetical protein
MNKKHWLEYATAICAFVAALAAIGAAIFSGWQVFVASDTEKRQTRAYAFPTPIPITHFSANDKPVGGVNIKTMGQTPAYNVRAEGFLRGMAYPLRADESLDLSRPDAVKVSAFIGATNVMNDVVTASEKWDQPAIEKARDGKAFRLFVWGRVDYEDVFKAPHWFTFCYSYDGQSIDRGEGGEPCPRYNGDDHSREHP